MTTEVALILVLLIVNAALVPSVACVPFNTEAVSANPKFKTAAAVVPELVTVGVAPTANVDTVPTATVAAAPAGPVVPVTTLTLAVGNT